MTAARPSTDRPTAALIALCATAALVAQFFVSRALPGLGGDGQAALWRMAGYFTVLTNVLVAIHWAGLALGLWRAGSATAGVVLSIIMVGLVYHLLLAGLWSPQGLGWWTDQGLHTAVPLMCLAWWIAFAPKAGLGRDALARWLIWPLAYCGYALSRGALTGFWPYPFLDPNLHGPVGVGVNVAILITAFIAAGVALLGMARVLR